MKAPPRATIREIPRGHSRKTFIDLEWTINRSDPNWVSPLRLSVQAALNPDKHPFHQRAEVAYFIAERGGEAVGRIAAIENRAHNEYHSDRVGFFGLFQCEDDQATAEMLFDAAGSWLKSRGLESIRGPLNFSTNEEVTSPGILIEGFETPPMIMMGHNPRYYGRLHDEAGFAKVKDVLALIMDRPEVVPERGVRVMDRLLARSGVAFRRLDLKNFRRDVNAIKEVYNAAWSRNWGFVPMADAEFEHLAKDFRPVVNPKLCLIAESGSEPVGFLLALPNLNEALRFLPSGRLLPFGWLMLLWHRNRIGSIRLMTVGFKPHLHRAGLGPLIYRHTWINAVEDGYLRGEASWVLEDNFEMIRGVERMGGKTYKRYRIYERRLLN
ncbi:MAG: N-acetyltransferase [Gemmatimonas sp.]|nr:N-acetyltransferase [Gemmatimonas sp.]